VTIYPCPLILSPALSPISFELQLVRLAAAVPPLAVAVVYRPPDGSKAAFLDELSEFLFQLASTSTDRILLCGDLNCPGPDAVSVDPAYPSCLPSTASTSMSALLPDWIPTTYSTCSPPKLALRQQRPRRHSLEHLRSPSRYRQCRCRSDNRQATYGYKYRDIRSIDAAEFERRLRRSVLFTSPERSTDAFEAQLRSVVTQLLDEMAPLRTSRSVSRNPSRGGYRVMPSLPSVLVGSWNGGGRAQNWKAID